jgi:uncharacterized membrane protein YeaQ/YmgE (transglycosylase-associated protein family)
MAVLNWVLSGVGMGLLVSWLVGGEFPGGVIGAVVAGAAGALIGGGLYKLLTDQGGAGFAGGATLLALVGAGVLLTAMRLAGARNTKTG